MALGIVVRLAGPLARDKRSDPAVVVVDEAGRFAVALLGRPRRGGANEEAEAVARILGALPVVTTASESLRLPAVDRIGADLGWWIERTENLTRVAASVVRGDPVLVLQEAGERDWWQIFGEWPEHFIPVETREGICPEDASFLFISDRLEPPGLPEGRTVVYRPRSLVAGIGCKRGTDAAVLEHFLRETLQRHDLAASSLAALATATLKADEPGPAETPTARGDSELRCSASQRRNWTVSPALCDRARPCSTRSGSPPSPRPPPCGGRGPIGWSSPRRRGRG